MISRPDWEDGVAGGLLTIDLGAIVRNYRLLVSLAGGARCAAVVKADAYGLGMARVAECLMAAGCTDFFVATATEGQSLRALLPSATVYVMNGPTPAAVQIMLDAELVPVLNTPEQVAMWTRPGSPRPCILHLDTGMHRLGLDPAQVRALAASTGAMDGLQVDYLMTHLACAEQPDHAMNAAQIRLFRELAALWPAVPTSIANSAGILLGREYCGDLARAGIALYGGTAGGEQRLPLAEVVGLYGRVLQIRDVERPGTVGYGASAAISPPARLATLGLGYADGYPRSLGNRGLAMAAGHRVPVVGRVSMDSVVVDVSELQADSLRVDDPVQLIGGGVGLDEVAALAGTISYEILTGLGSRLERRYLS